MIIMYQVLYRVVYEKICNDFKLITSYIQIYNPHFPFDIAENDTVWSDGF